MKFISNIFLTLALVFIVHNSIYATIIVPNENISILAEQSDLCVYGKVLDEHTVVWNGTERYRYTFEVQMQLYGQQLSNQIITLEIQKTTSNGYTKHVWGDPLYELDAHYLLFLNKYDDAYRANMLSYGVLKEGEYDGQSVLAYDIHINDIHIIELPNGPKPDPLAVYKKELLLKHMDKVLNQSADWDFRSVVADITLEEYLRNMKAAPAHCTYLAGGPGGRWTYWDVNGPATALPVYCDDDLDVDYANSHVDVGSAIADMNTNFTGLTLSNFGTTAFAPPAGCTDAADEISTYMNSSLGGGNNVLVTFNDPCDEITDLVACSGVLAVGGHFGTGTHTFDGSAGWTTAGYGFVIVNNGTGACLPGSYELIMEHEMCHSLGIGHIAAGTGSALMNPSCCNSVSALDIACLNFTYPLAFPIELGYFVGDYFKGEVLLNWETNSELNNDHFVIERSFDGRQYEYLAKIKGQGTSIENVQYSYIDEEPLRGINYYRLKQIDHDGSFEYHNTISVNAPIEQHVSIYPNPLHSDALNIELGVQETLPVDVVIFNIMGDAVFRSTYDHRNIQAELPNLSSGTYIVSIKGKGFEHTDRILIAN